jgi:hypothetical protein
LAALIIEAGTMGAAFQLMGAIFHGAAMLAMVASRANLSLKPLRLSLRRRKSGFAGSRKPRRLPLFNRAIIADSNCFVKLIIAND